MKRYRRPLQRGGSLLSLLTIVVALMLAGGIGWFSYAEYRRHYWDEKVRELCEKEGAGVVLQHIEVAPGNVPQSAPDERYADAGAAYVSRWQEQVIRVANPRVLRTEVILVRVRDQEILGRQVRFARIGGDTGFADNPSTFSCSDLGTKSIEALVFFTTGESK